MLLVDSSGKCIIYTLCQDNKLQVSGSKIKIVEWRPITFINDLQSELLWRTRTLYLFTPDFTHYIDYNYNMKQWVVKPTRPGKHRVSAKDEEVYIPEDFLTTVFKDQDRNKTSPCFIASRMYLASPNHLRLTNSDGVDCVFNIRTKQVETYAKVPGLQTADFPD